SPCCHFCPFGGSPPCPDLNLIPYNRFGFGLGLPENVQAVLVGCGGMRVVCVHRRRGFSPPPRLPLFYCCCSLLLFRWAEAHPTMDTTDPHSAAANQSSLHIFRQPNPNIKPFIVN
ncbi:hypothetical protein, partial [Neisseria meningitidis]|uniref:hypothetical protein n=1 Tax=Neisseria meningitidis TaxID=487 RepID=UPI001C591E12